MDPRRIAIMGIGSRRRGPATVAALTACAEDFDLELRFWDADAERLDLFDRLARVCFRAAEVEPRLLTLSDPAEALERADGVIVAVGRNCARCFLAPPAAGRAPAPTGSPVDLELAYAEPGVELQAEEPVEDVSEEDVRLAIGRLLAGGDRGRPTLDLTGLLDRTEPEVVTACWPEDPGPERRRRLPLQILRWVLADESVSDLLAAYRDSPVREWLGSAAWGPGSH